MRSITVTKTQSDVNRLIDEAVASHEPIHIAGRNSHAVLVSEEDWRAIQETLYLLSIPKMRESIRRGLRTPVEKCSTELRW